MHIKCIVWTGVCVRGPGVVINTCVSDGLVSLSLRSFNYHVYHDVETWIVHYRVDVIQAEQLVACLCFYLHGEGDERSLRRSSQQSVIPDDRVVTHTSNLTHTHTHTHK